MQPVRRQAQNLYFWLFIIFLFFFFPSFFAMHFLSSLYWFPQKNIKSSFLRCPVHC